MSPKRPRILPLCLLLALAACASNPLREHRQTRVSRELRATSNVPRVDAYFAAVHGYQKAFARADALRVESLVALNLALGLTENAEQMSVEAALRLRLSGARAAGVRVSVESGDTTDALVTRWQEAVVAGGGENALLEVESSLRVTVTATEGDLASVQPVVRAVEQCLRRAEALRLAFERLGNPIPEVLRDTGDLRAQTPAAQRAELDDAMRFGRSVRARAAVHMQESRRVTLWLVGLLMPEGAQDTATGSSEEGPS